MRRLTFTDSTGQVTILGNPATTKMKFTISSLEGMGSAALNRFVQKSPYQDGNVAIDTLLSERVITVQGAIYDAKNLATIMTRRRELTRGFNPKLGQGTLLYEYDGGSKTAFVTLAQGPVFSNKAATNPFQTYQISFIANDPWLYGPSIPVAANVTAWAKVPTSIHYPNNLLAYGNGVFLSFYYSGGNFVCMTSADSGYTWTTKGSLTGTGWNKVVFGGGVFIAINNSTYAIAYSQDSGATWPSAVYGSPYAFSDIAYGNGITVAVYANKTWYSLDGGRSWNTGMTVPSGETIDRIAYGGGKFIIVGHTTSCVSTDGITFTASGATTGSKTWVGLSYGNSIMLAIASDGTTMKTANLAVAWSAGAALNNTLTWSALDFGCGIFVAVASAVTSGGAATVITQNTYDSTAWVTKNLAEAAKMTNVVYGNGSFLTPLDADGKLPESFTGVTINNAGDYATPVSITLTGPGTNPILYQGDASYIRIVKTIAATESVLISTTETAPSIVYYAGNIASNGLKYLDLLSILWQIPAGRSFVFYSDSTNSSTMQCSFTYRERFAGV